MAAAGNSKNYLLRHWRGELPLGRAYWIDTVGLNLLIELATVIFVFGAFQPMLEVTAALIPCLWIFFIALAVWQTVGVARSAFRYEEEGGGVALPLLACFSMLMRCVLGVVLFVVSGLPQLSDAIKIYRGDPEWPDPVITVLSSGWEMEYSGTIKRHSASRLEEALRRNPKVILLHLDTIGGRISEAVSMAKVVRAHRLSTYVDQTCASAGVLVFLAGKNRTMRSNAHLGFHSAHSEGTFDFAANRTQASLLTSAGATQDFINHALQTPPDSIWYPTLDELQKQGLVLQISDGTGFSIGTRELASYSVEGLTETLSSYPIMRALEARSPKAYAAAIAYAAKSFAQGWGSQTSMQELATLKATTITESVPYASEEALDACLDFQMEVFERNMYREPKQTLLFLWNHSIVGTFPDFPTDAETRYDVALLESPRTPTPPIERKKVADEFASLYLSQLTDENKQYRGIPLPADRAGQIAVCEIMNNVLAAMKQLPPERRGPLIRYILLDGYKK
jgi:hypothetical protein